MTIRFPLNASGYFSGYSSIGWNGRHKKKPCCNSGMLFTAFKSRKMERDKRNTEFLKMKETCFP